ncbi:hypothetical protein PVK06_016764 [Gossypium arboreum]|uniref:Uncharacterized protein n=1 Tax=Gossypium arboreum TaxID=29729 RepID=A0ABR0Q1B5_GOSAR|nr:hypothetical protein PVK06_016764 [Gossypium arboreum]
MREVPREERHMEDIRMALKDFQLVDIGYSRSWFTREMGNLSETIMRERLDRGVANMRWMNLFPKSFV